MSKLKTNIINDKKVYYVLEALIGFVVCFCLGEFGPILMDDSGGYIYPEEFMKSSYWLYIKFIQICRIIFGENTFLIGVWVLQSLFAIITSVVLTEYFRKQYKLSYAKALFVYVCSFFPYLYTLPENVTTHHILTEGLSIPLFVLLFLFIIKCFNEEKKKDLLYAGGFAILIALTRSQMAIFFALYIVCVVAYIFRSIFRRINIRIKKYYCIGIVIIVLISACLGIGLMKEMIVKDVWKQFTIAVSGRAMCLVEYEDIELFEGEYQLVYDRLYQHIDENKNRFVYFQDGLGRVYDIIDACNENTQEYRLVISDYYIEKYPDWPMHEVYMQAYEVGRIIATKIFEANFSEYLKMTLQLIPQSLVASIFIQPEVIMSLCYMIALFLYCSSFLLIIYALYIKVEWKYIMPVLLTYIFLFGNVVVTNIVFFGLQRYVIYTFGAFYISVFLLLIGIRRKKLRGVF